MNKEEVYDGQISPLMTKIIQICKEHNISAFCTFALDENPEADEDENGELPTLWCSTSLPVSERESDNVEINKHYSVRYKGYGVVPNFFAMTVSSK